MDEKRIQIIRERLGYTGGPSNDYEDACALLREIERLREALKLIYEMPSDAPAAFKICKGIARGALNPTEFADIKERPAPQAK